MERAAHNPDRRPSGEPASPSCGRKSLPHPVRETDDPRTGRWRLRTRLVFIVGATLALWAIIALLFSILI